MNKKEKFVITINRELGSGGRTVGEILAKSLEVPFYDKAVIKALTEKLHLTIDEIEKLKGKKDNWWTDFQRNVFPFYDSAKLQYYNVNDNTDPELITSAELFRTESKVLTEIAEKESCVIAGRSGFFVLRNHPNHLSILIQAPMENRIQRVMEKQGLERDKAVKDIKKVDNWRENYIKKYTGTSRYDTRNYDLVINMANLSEADAANIILEYIEKTNH